MYPTPKSITAPVNRTCAPPQPDAYLFSLKVPFNIIQLGTGTKPWEKEHHRYVHSDDEQGYHSDAYSQNLHLVRCQRGALSESHINLNPRRGFLNMTRAGLDFP